MSSSIDRLVIEHFSARKDFYTPLIAKDELGDRILNSPYDIFSSSRNFLELGTGSGRLLEYLSQKGMKSELFGVDFCKELLKEGKNRYRKDLDFILADVRHLPFRMDSFDSVACRGLFHHMVSGGPLQNVSLTSKEVRRVLKDGGVFFVNEECFDRKVGSRIIFLVSYMLAKLNVPLPYFEIYAKCIAFFLTPKELHTLIDSSSFKILEWMEIKWNMQLRYKLTLLVSRTNYVQLTAIKNIQS